MRRQEPFQQSLDLIAEATRIFLDPWHLIGSAAAKISGADVGPVNDIDILLSKRDNTALKTYWANIDAIAVAPNARFRSKVFYRFMTPLPIETMSDFELKAASGEWIAISPDTRVQYGNLYAPDIAEQISILQLMNRSKDAARITALKKMQDYS